MIKHMKHQRQKTYKTFYTYVGPMGSFSIAGEGEAVTAVAFGMPNALPDWAQDGATFKPSLATNACANQLLQYFAGKRRYFDVELKMNATEFKQEVWRAVGLIDYGCEATAAQIADEIDRPGTHRIVGLACNECPIAILVPTHRIVHADGYYDKNDRKQCINAALRNLERRSYT
jgi:methylated-DNA-[protein]-cysteine S-methyltransferase